MKKNLNYADCKSTNYIRKNSSVTWGVGTLILWLAGVLFALSYWAFGAFGRVEFSIILFHLREPLEGSNMEPFLRAVPQVAAASFLFALFGFLLARNCDTDRQLVCRVCKKQFTVSLNFWHRKYIFHALITLGLSIAVGFVYLGIPQYVRSQIHSSSLYEEYYVEPKSVTVTFPEKKQNLIYIFMESMENTFMSIEDGGLEYAEMIPEMHSLQLLNTNFTADSGVNGAISAYGSTWTMGAMVAQTAGIPLNIPVGGNAMGDGYEVLQGVVSLGDILEKEGYRQVFLLGSDAEFGGRKYYMTAHGNYEIMDYGYAIRQEWIPEDYYVWWGYEDRKLYEYAKLELEALYETKEPFNLTMLTVDTHFTGGYYCDECQDEFGEDTYADVYACASRQVAEFVEWVQKQPFADDTTIVICGDHLTMDSEYITNTLGEIPAEGMRKVYTVIINPVVSYELDYDRSFTTFDMYPTTLASLGCTIEGERMALGTNLFSDVPTLLEQMGIDTLNEELKKNSRYYNRCVLYGKE